MRTIDEIYKARTAVVELLKNPHLSDQQRTIAAGMSTALCWVAESGGDALQRLIDGEKIVEGNTVPMSKFGR